MKQVNVLLVSISLALGLAGCYGTGTARASSGQKELTVTIGKSASSANRAYSHNLSIEALNQGRSECEVQSSASHSYKGVKAPYASRDLRSGGSTAVLLVPFANLA